MTPLQDLDATRCDVVVVGGGAAGLAAALQLGRSRRSVVVVDAGDPRNAPAAHMHGYLGHDGRSPGEFLALARAEVAAYGVEFVDGAVAKVTGDPSGDGFAVTLRDRTTLACRRVVLATGLVDGLPDIPGVADQWGRGVIHCPYCHGWEVRDQRIVIIATVPLAAHSAMLFRQLSDQVTVVEHVAGVLDDEGRRLLTARGVRIETGPVARVVVEDDMVRGVHLADDRRIDADAVVVASRMTARVVPFEPLAPELADAPMGMGTAIRVDERGATSVPGVYAAGNAADVAQQVLHAAAHGSRVGAMINAELAHQDAAISASTSGGDTAEDWDRRYSAASAGGHDAGPDDTLVDGLSDLSPGTALELCCGEGSNAIWLAGRGWKVTAVDISQVALDRAAKAAAQAGVEVDWIQGDVTTEPVVSGRFDLVSMHYPALRHTPDDRALHAIVDAVAPGGTLLFVHHAPDVAHRDRGFDPEDYLAPADVARRLGHGWTIEVDETRPRAAAPHHGGPVVPDIVLRARRG